MTSAETTLETPPFDTCSVVAWTDFPAALQPNPPNSAPPTPLPPSDDALFRTACLFDAADDKTVISWGQPPDMAVDPSGHADERQVDIDGHPAIYRLHQISDGSRTCLLFVDLGDGRGIASVAAYTRRAEIDPCATALGLATLIVDRVS